MVQSLLRGGLALCPRSKLLLTVEHFALEVPDLDADDAVRGLRLGKAVIDVGAQGMQRHATLAVPLAARDLGPIQASSHVDPYPLRAHAHGIADRTTHRAAEHDAPLQLLRYTFGDQLGVQLRLANLLHVHMDRNTHELAEIAPQALNVFALFADHHARPRGVNGHQRVLGRPLDIDATERSMTQLLLD